MMSMQLTDSRAMLVEESTNGRMWHKRSHLEKVLFIAVGVLLLLCVATVIALIVLEVQVNETESRMQKAEAELSALLDSTTEVLATSTQPEVVATSTQPQVVTTSTQPEVVATSTNPEAVATSTQPEITVTSTEPEIAATSTKPEIAATTTEPEIAATSTEPAVALDSYCLTSACIKSAAELLQGMDETVDPCEDFYTFTCGNWNKKNPIPGSKSRWTQFDMLRDDLSYSIKLILEREAQENDSVPLNAARDMYSACMDLDKIDEKKTAPLTDALTEMESRWPLLFHIYTMKQYQLDWVKVVGEIKRRFSGNFLLTPYVYLDDKNTLRSVIYIDQTSLGLSRPVILGNESDITRAYTNYIYEAALVLRNNWPGGEKNKNNVIKEEVMNIFKFEIELANITTPMELRRDKQQMYNPMTVEELTTLTKNKIDWRLYLDTLFHGTEESINDEDEIIVVEPEYLQKLVDLLNRTASNTLANYIYWRLVQQLGPQTNKEMRDLEFQFSQVLTGSMAPEPRWLVCASMANNFFGMAISTPYVQEEFDEKAKGEALKMIQNIRSSFKELVAQAKWMDKKTMDLAQQKADAMKEFIAYPDWILLKENMTEYFDGINVTAENHFNNVVSMTSWWVRKELNDLRRPTDKNRWITFPTTVNAFYSSNYNSISFPAGILQPPFFGDGRLRALDYGGIGTVIGHEITHGFDDRGRQTDKDGNSIQWWSNSTIERYIEQATCFIDQYSGYKVTELQDKIDSDIMLNGINTQGENIADNGGIRQAFRAYMKYIEMNGSEKLLPALEKYPPEKLFFLGFANIWCGQYTSSSLMNQVLTGVHSPGRFRVLGSLSNSEDFSRVWNCSLTSQYNAQNKCILW